jgi:hypothetical protein
MTESFTVTLPDNIAELKASVDRSLAEELIDPMAGGIEPPGYKRGLLPPVFEDMALYHCYMNAGVMELYAGSFGVAVSAMLDRSVQVQVTSDPKSLTPLIEFAGIVGDSASGKSPTWKTVMATTLERERVLFSAETAKYQTAAKQTSDEKKRNPHPGHFPHFHLNNVTIERFIKQQVINDGIPLAFADTEIQSLYSGMASHVSNHEGFQKFSENINKAFDGDGISLARMGADDLYAPWSYSHLYFAGTPQSVLSWKYLEEAIRNGFYGRFNITYGTKNLALPRDEEKAKRLYAKAGVEWGIIETRLQKLREVTFALGEEDEELKRRWFAWLERRTQEARMLAETSPGLATWVRKSEWRVKRAAARFAALRLVQGELTGIDRSDKIGITGASVIIGEEDLSAAVRFNDEFLLPQQKYFYNVMLVGSEFDEFLKHLFFKLLANEVKEMSKDEFWGHHCTPTSLRRKPEFIRERFASIAMGYGWLEVHPNARNKGDRSPVNASKFVVHPRFHEKFAVYKELAKAHWAAITNIIRETDW